MAAAKSRIACLRGPLGGSNNGKKLICLVSRGCGHDRCQSLNQSRALGWLASRGVPHEIVDGTDPNAGDLRERLFAISNFDRMEMLNKMSGLPPKVLATHPKLMTMEDIHFGTTANPPRHRHDRRPRQFEAAGREAVVAVALRDAPASIDICMEAMTATETTTATEMVTTATKMATTVTKMVTGHPPSDSHPPLTIGIRTKWEGGTEHGPRGGDVCNM